MNQPGQQKPAQSPVRTARSDLSLVLMLVLVFFATAAQWELAEKLAHWLGGYEHWQLDELPLTLLVLSAGLGWYAWRRSRVARLAMQERMSAQAHVADLLAHNRELAQRLILAEEKERAALARELHDEVGQNCTAIRVEASFLVHAKTGDLAGVEACAQRIDQAASRLYGLVRNMLQRLRPVALDSLGLEAALQELCESWETQYGVPCVFYPRGIGADSDDPTRMALYRLVQEGLTNVARHANASQVRVELGASPGANTLVLVLQDNGKGMPTTPGPPRGFGLVGMRERVAGLNGSIQFDSTPGQGLRIRIELPAGGRAA